MGRAGHRHVPAGKSFSARAAAAARRFAGAIGAVTIEDPSWSLFLDGNGLLLTAGPGNSPRSSTYLNLARGPDVSAPPSDEETVIELQSRVRSVSFQGPPVADTPDDKIVKPVWHGQRWIIREYRPSINGVTRHGWYGVLYRGKHRYLLNAWAPLDNVEPMMRALESLTLR